MRVLHVAKYYPPHRGGIESVTMLLAEATSEQGHSVTVLCCSGNEETFEEKLNGVSVIRVGSFGAIASVEVSISYARMLRILAKTADVLHVHLPNPLALLSMAVAPRLPPRILHWHAAVPKEKSWLLRAVHKPIESLAVRDADAVIFPSFVHRESSQYREVVGSKSRVIELPVARCGCVLPSARTRRNRILAVGRLVSYKGFDVLIEAMRYLPNDVVLRIVGDGPLMGLLVDQIDRSRLGERIELLGAVNDEKLHESYRWSDVFCLSSTTSAEMFGLVQVEAMRHGKPVVSTRISGSAVADVNRHGVTGLVVRPGDARELAGAVAQLLRDDSLYAACAAASRELAVTSFDPARVSAKTIETYNVVIAARR